MTHPTSGTEKRPPFFLDGPPISKGEKLVPIYGTNKVDDEREAFTQDERAILDGVWLPNPERANLSSTPT